MQADKGSDNRLSPYIGRAGAWALSLGTAIGWGSLVVTSTAYLSQAGPAGSIAGLLIGAAIMLVIARNYHYMINAFPDAGGGYAYAKETFGYDHGFLLSWFLILTYAAILWANATSLPLFARYFIGDVFRKGMLYTIFGYDVYLGEALLTFAGLLITMLLCTSHRRFTISIMVFFSAVLTVCISAAFIGTIAGHSSAGTGFDPAFIPDKSSLSQIVRIACISPWAFIGFENISHSSEEFTFPRTKVFSIMAAAVAVAAALYIFVLLMSVSAYPPQYGSWLEYINDLGSLSGIEGLPAFYAAYRCMGTTGVTLLVTALFGLIATSLIGNTIALSRLLYALAKDSIIHPGFAVVNNRHIPSKALWLIMLLSLPVPFLGRTAIGWIVDVTTIGATLIYFLVSASAVKIADIRNDKTERITGRAGAVFMLLFGAYLLIPNFFTAGSIEKETFFLFVVWGILGFIFFRIILKRDSEKRFGKSLIVWIALLSLVLLISLIWMSQSMMDSTGRAMDNIHSYYIEEGGVTSERAADEQFIEEQFAELRSSNARTIMAATAMFAFAVVILLTNYSYMNKRQKESELELGHARAIAYTDPLTGVKNKRAFAEKEKELNEQITDPAAGPPAFSVVVCDVNGLKHVNDTYGHKAGDSYIRAASRLICETFQHSPVFRVGGDEFVVILSGRDYEDRSGIMEEFNRIAEANIGSDDVVISAGISDFDPAVDTGMQSVFARADSLMYEHKQQLKEMGSKSR